jgi:D-3-phosphoglycerate dehydrogenase / 2-oxoglutarate reductase
MVRATRKVTEKLVIVIYFDRTDKQRHCKTEPVDRLEEQLAQSDVVSLHVPETPETHLMIG